MDGIRTALDADVAPLQRIETAAGEAFRSVGLEVVADDLPPTREELAPYLTAGRAWVVDEGAGPVAYLLGAIVDGDGHIEQVSVHPDRAGRGLGAALIETFVGWTARQGLPAVTLTTYLDVPWNGPYYARLGFRWLRDDEITPGLRRIRDEEIRRGLDVRPRGCMRRELG